MKVNLPLVFLVLSLIVISGCGSGKEVTKYVCPDGSVVTDTTQCLDTENLEGSKSCALFPGLGCNNFKVTNDGSPHVTMVVQNGIGEDIKDVMITLVGDDNSCVSVLGTPTLTTLSDGEEITFNFDCTGDAPTGNMFKSDVAITYIDSGGLSHSNTGQIISEVE